MVERSPRPRLGQGRPDRAAATRPAKPVLEEGGDGAKLAFRLKLKCPKEAAFANQEDWQTAIAEPKISSQGLR